MAILGGIPLLHQPGEGFAYNAAFDILEVLVARAGGAALPELMAGRLFGLLGMTDTGSPSPPGGTGTSAYVVPADGSVAVLRTQVQLAGPTGSQVIEGFWTAAAEHLGHDRA